MRKKKKKKKKRSRWGSESRKKGNVFFLGWTHTHTQLVEYLKQMVLILFNTFTVIINC